MTISCGGNGKQRTEQTPATIETKRATDSTEVFIAFWQTLRHAIINNDTNTIIESTIFPIETRGPMDSDPIIKYERKDFVKVFSAFLKQQENEGTEMDNIKKTEQPDMTYFNNTEVRVGDLVFNNADGKWKLTFAYLLPYTIDELKK